MTDITTYEQLVAFTRGFTPEARVTGELARRICTVAEVEPSSEVAVTRNYREFRVHDDVLRTPDHRIQVGWRDMGLEGIIERLNMPAES